MSLILPAPNRTMVFDASIVAKYMLPSENTDSILRAVPTNIDRIAPSIIELEIASMLCKHVRLAALSQEIADEELTSWTDALRDGWIHIYPAQDYMTAAFKIACEIKHPFYDCCYLALARQEGCALITADRKLYERGISIYNDIILIT